MNQELGHSDEGEVIEKTPRRIDWNTVAVVFLVGISVGALIPVGMKFFGVWNKPQTSSAKAIDDRTPEAASSQRAKPVHRLKRVAAQQEALESEKPARENLPEKDTKSQQLAASALGEMTLAAKETKSKLRSDAKEKKSVSNKEAASVPAASSSPAPLPASVSSVKSQEKAKKGETAPILEEMKSGPSAIEIQNLTLAYTAAKEGRAPVAAPTAESKSVSTPATVTVVAVKTEAATAPVSSAQAVQSRLLSLSAKPSVANAPASPKPGLLTAMNAPEAKSKPAEGEAKVVAMVVNNASYNKASLSACQKRCLLMGVDAFGMPIKAIIDGATYGQALKQHNGTINLAGQPRLVKNQQVLIVESITFNLGPKPVQPDANVNPAMKNPIPSDPDDPRPGTVLNESN